jgi:hypothetical protein
MSKSNKDSEKTLGYMILLEKKEGNIFYSSLLTVDMYGFPKEYSYSDKIIVTPIQKTLYGSKLKNYLVKNVFGKIMIEKLDNPPSLILVNDKSLLDIRSEIDIPVLFASGDKKNTSFTSFENYKDDETKASEIARGAKFDLFEPFSRIESTIDEVLE